MATTPRRVNKNVHEGPGKATETVTPKDHGKSPEAIIAERGKTHGNFLDNASVSQGIKGMLQSGPNYKFLSFTQKEALDMIAHKMARIVSGNANEPDHWRDIAGYSMLECNGLESGEH